MNISLAFTIIKRFLSYLDAKIRINLDRILPRNLTVRYIAALCTIGLLSILGQIVVQLSLTRLENDQKLIRLIETKIQESENIRKEAVALHVGPSKQKNSNQYEAVLNWLNLLESKQRFLDSEDIQLKIQLDTPLDLPQLADREKKAILGIKQNFWILHSILSDSPHPLNNSSKIQVTALIKDLLQYETRYEETLRAIGQFYEQRLIQQTSESHQLELSFLLATLILLIIEGLYVYRPSVESLYEALRTRSDFLGRMGHEIRNPMNSIIGMTNLLYETPLSAQQRKYLSTLRKSSGNLLEMLNNILDFSTVESKRIKLERIPFNLNELVERSIDLAVFGAHANGIELILDLGLDVPFQLIGDPSRLQQILANLLGNALKFTKVGEVTLQVILIKLSEEAHIQFSVLDTGMGIDKQKIHRIFHPFVQGDSSVRRRFGGAGLGLSIATDLVKLMGGRLEVQSEKNVGSRFFFTIPFRLDPQAGPDTSMDQVLSRGKKRDPFEVILLEPNLKIAALLGNLIYQMGGSSQTVDANNAKNLFNQSNKNSLFILDFESLKGTLNDLLSYVRLHPDVLGRLILLVKTTTSSEELEKLAECGINNFLFKPVKPSQLIEFVRFVSTGEKEFKGEPSQEPLIHDHRSLRILAADDSKDNQFLIKAYLESLPYRITFADNGLIALQKFKEARFDIILMDLQMPEMDGYSAVEAIRQWEKRQGLRPIPIIAVTAHDYEYEFLLIV